MDVESKLYQCSGVEQAIVRPFTDEEGLSYMIAYIVPKENSLKVSQVRQELSDSTHTACFVINEERGEIIGCGGICYQREMLSPDNLTGTNGYLIMISDAKESGTQKIYLESSVGAKQLYREIGFSDMKNYMKLEG